MAQKSVTTRSMTERSMTKKGISMHVRNRSNLRDRTAVLLMAGLACLGQSQKAQSQTAQSQTQSQTSLSQAAMPLSLKRAVDLALAPDGNVRVAMAQELIEQARTEQLEAKSPFLPDFDASLAAEASGSGGGSKSREEQPVPLHRRAVSRSAAWRGK